MSSIEQFSSILLPRDQRAYAMHVARWLGSDPEEGPRGSWIQGTDPLDFLARLAVGLERRERLWLVPPRWSESEKGQLQQIVEADTAFGAPGDILIPTGGSSGRIKCARHTVDTLKHAASALHQRLEQPISSWVNLPMAHVSGLMPIFRALVSEGICVFGHTVPPRPRENIGLFTTSIVGTQLKRILENANGADYQDFDILFIGGGPVDPSLLTQARERDLPLAPCYGATETGAMVALLEPVSFLNGQLHAGTALPGVAIEVTPDQGIDVTSKANCLGYAGEPRLPEASSWTSGDLGRIDADGALHVSGRQDRIIITGGEKVNPIEVEACLRRFPEVRDALVIGVPHPKWGREVVALIESNTGTQIPEMTGLELASYKRPKRIKVVDKLPIRENGKLDPSQLEAVLENLGTKKPPSS